MKKISLIIAVALFANVSWAKKTEVSQDAKIEVMCRKAADKAIDVYWNELFDENMANEKENLEPGDDLPDADYIMTMWDLFDTGDDGTYIYSWSEHEECACGVNVDTKVSKDKKSCSAKVDYNSHDCDCG